MEFAEAACVLPSHQQVPVSSIPNDEVLSSAKLRLPQPDFRGRSDKYMSRKVLDGLVVNPIRHDQKS